MLQGYLLSYKEIKHLKDFIFENWSYKTWKYLCISVLYILLSSKAIQIGFKNQMEKIDWQYFYVLYNPYV